MRIASVLLLLAVLLTGCVAVPAPGTTVPTQQTTVPGETQQTTTPTVTEPTTEPTAAPTEPAPK